ncbi:hypothetical protein Tsubulata_027149 [Turnera subulata]|uniref:3'-5' exonuclease domain-containing protein n=1 Tax=Turnera subulata TaxID=218843 RepID=A0A9Q0FR58_9ROSI|nr:hypothetical protein Tsubulata_027149 [Turnera subulata]
MVQGDPSPPPLLCSYCYASVFSGGDGSERRRFLLRWRHVCERPLEVSEDLDGSGLDLPRFRRISDRERNTDNPILLADPSFPQSSLASEVLAKLQKSLAYLLETYCSVATNKLFQREGWRQRPLCPEMLEYARTDAHYLLYIAGCLIAELKQQDSGMPLSLFLVLQPFEYLCSGPYPEFPRIPQVEIHRCAEQYS